MRFPLYFTLLLMCYALLGQDGRYNLGARNAGLGGASLTLSDGWSLFNNIGAIGFVENSQAALAYQNRFNLSAFQVVGGGYTQTSKWGNAGIGFYRFGDDLFNQQKLSIGFGNNIDLVSLGANINLVQFSIESIGTTSAVVLEFGGLAKITDTFIFGAHIYNINQASITPEEDIPTIAKAGFSFRPITSLMVNMEVEKDLDFPEVIKGGLEYQIIEWVRIRTGISTRPIKTAFGFGLLYKSAIIDYAYSDQTDLGGIHELSLSYSFGKK